MYVIMAFDKPDSAQLRLDTRPAHIEYVLSRGSIIAGGPFMSEDGETMIGSLVVLDVASHAEAQAFAADDPYNKAGLFEKIEIRRWNHIIGGLPDISA